MVNQYIYFWAYYLNPDLDDSLQGKQSLLALYHIVKTISESIHGDVV